MKSVTSRTTLALGIVLTAVLVGGIVAPTAAFANVYNGGYMATSPTASNSFQFKSKVLDYAATRSFTISSLLSTTGFATSGSTDPTYWVHQIATRLETSNSLTRSYAVFNNVGTKVFGTATTGLGTLGTGSNNVNYIYHNLAWSGTTLLFYWDKVENDGDITGFPVTYDAVAKGDPSRVFKYGQKSKAIDEPCSGTMNVKLMQFGVESGAPVTQTWKIKQYDIWKGGSSLSSTSAKSTTGGCASGDSWVSYGPFGSEVGGARVADSDYTNVNAKYNKNDATVPDGQVHWYKDGSSTTIGNDVALWP